MAQPAHIQVSNLTHAFRSGQRTLTALSKVNLNVARGSFVSVVGPSGAGKTTLLKLIGGLVEPSSGHITIGGLPAAEAQRRKAIGFVFQAGGLLPWRTVLQNVRLPLELNPSHSGASEYDPDQVVELVGLGEFRDYHPHQLSGGMRQRVALARALVMNPEVLLMDEPLSALDEITRGAMAYEVSRLWEQFRHTVVFITHSISEAVALSNRVIVMSPRPGRIVKDVRIDLPRPRTDALEASTAFLEYVRYIKANLSLAA